jgi:hypothetical protein
MIVLCRWLGAFICIRLGLFDDHTLVWNTGVGGGGGGVEWADVATSV